ncbi:MAG: lamin tail domain-containing protein [Chitinispirillales bacterium]|jgi:hypothetical protein|nr:lamin tail domain-containing protein [Chitinispirillales bacterium]
MLLTSALLLLYGCAEESKNDPVKPQDGEYGMLEVCVRVVNQPLKKGAAQNGTGASDAVAQTVAENLVVEISGNELSPTQFKVKLNAARSTAVDTVKKVPIGEARRISVWAVNKDGGKTHVDTAEYRYVDIEKARVTRIFATLIPAAGSIYIHINGLETSISTVHASFTSRDGELVFRNSVARAAHTFLSIDNIPHELDGILRVSLVDNKADTVKIATSEFVFNAQGDNVFDLQFIENSGMLGMDAVLYAPGVTIVSYDVEKPASNVVETGELIITEIMYSAGDDNYIELYNPGNKAVSFDTLTTEVDKTTYYFAGVSIGANGYFVIGRRALPYSDINTNTTGGLPISSTGNWITVRRGRGGNVLDRVICGGTNSAVGWPAGLSPSSKKAVELSRDKYGAMENNFGKNWVAAEQLISGTGNMYGTPGM